MICNLNFNMIKSQVEIKHRLREDVPKTVYLIQYSEECEEMNVIVCVDDKNGLMFNHRRQSQDRMLREYLSGISGGKLWMNAYSAEQFRREKNLKQEIREDFLEAAPRGEYCFLENLPCRAYEDRIEKIIVCRWNREYPSDRQFDIPLAEHRWRCISAEEIPGSSHEKITVEVYER